MTDKTAASEARRLRIFADQCQGQDGGAALIEKEISKALDSFARVEVLRGRLEEHKVTCARCSLADAGERIAQGIGCERRAEEELLGYERTLRRKL